MVVIVHSDVIASLYIAVNFGNSVYLSKTLQFKNWQIDESYKLKKPYISRIVCFIIQINLEY